MGYVRMSTGIVKMVEIAKKHKDELLRQITEQIIYPEDEIGRTAIDSVYELIVEQPKLITERIGSLSSSTEPVPKKRLRKLQS